MDSKTPPGELDPALIAADGTEITEQDAESSRDVTALGWARIAGTVLYMALATLEMASISSQTTVAAKVISGAIFAALVLAIVGSLNWAVAARKRGRSWSHATLSPGPLCISFLLVVLSAVGQRSGG